MKKNNKNLWIVMVIISIFLIGFLSFTYLTFVQENKISGMPIFFPKIWGIQSYKFMIANDLHYGYYTAPNDTTSYDNLKLAVMNTPNLRRVFLNGDLSYADNTKPDQLIWVRDFLNNNITPIVPYSVIMGNHDNPGPNYTFNGIFGLSSTNYSFDERGYHFIITKYTGGDHLNSEQLQWIQNDLNLNNNKPTFIFAHVPQSKIYCTTNPTTGYPDCRNPERTQVFTYENSGFSQIINQNNNIIGVFYGHVHNWGENLNQCGPLYSPMHCEYNITTQTDTCFGGYAIKKFEPCNYDYYNSNNPSYPRTPTGYRIVEIFSNGTIYTAYRNSTNIFNEYTFKSDRLKNFIGIQQQQLEK